MNCMHVTWVFVPKEETGSGKNIRFVAAILQKIKWDRYGILAGPIVRNVRAEEASRRRDIRFGTCTTSCCSPTGSESKGFKSLLAV